MIGRSSLGDALAVANVIGDKIAIRDTFTTKCPSRLKKAAACPLVIARGGSSCPLVTGVERAIYSDIATGS